MFMSDWQLLWSSLQCCKNKEDGGEDEDDEDDGKGDVNNYNGDDDNSKIHNYGLEGKMEFVCFFALFGATWSSSLKI